MEPANGSVPPAITRLRRLARLHVVGTLEGNIVELPPGFGALGELSYLRFEGVTFRAETLENFIVGSCAFAELCVLI